MLIQEHIKIPLYGGILVIMITDRNVMVKDHYDDLGCGIELDYGHCFQINTLPDTDGKQKRCIGIGLNINNEYAKMTYGTITHEALHATDLILNHAGVRLSAESVEAYAYLIGWVADQIYNIFSRNNIAIYLRKDGSS